MYDVFHMGNIAPVEADESSERIAEHVGNGTFQRLRKRLIEHDPLPQSATADRERLNVQIIRERFNDRKRRGHNIGTVGRQTADAFALFQDEPERIKTTVFSKNIDRRQYPGVLDMIIEASTISRQPEWNTFLLEYLETV